MNIHIIGAGNMGAAIGLGLGSPSFFKENRLEIHEIDLQKLEELGKKESKLILNHQNYASLSMADIIILAIRNEEIENFLDKELGHFNKKALLVSVVANFSLGKLDALVNTQPAHQMPIFRLMPNTAISLKQSMTFMCSLKASLEQEKTIKMIFEKLGKLEIIEETLFPGATSLASCGTAYAFRYIRASMEAGIEMGFSPQASQNAVLQCLKGAISVLEASQAHPEAEIDRVCTPGGITIRGLNELEKKGFSASIFAAHRKSTKLA